MRRDQCLLQWVPSCNGSESWMPQGIYGSCKSAHVATADIDMIAQIVQGMNMGRSEDFALLLLLLLHSDVLFPRKIPNASMESMRILAC
eukprot:SAG31_NODE_438_length_15693_cov_6.254248_6_plen_89_part_00